MVPLLKARAPARRIQEPQASILKCDVRFSGRPPRYYPGTEGFNRAGEGLSSIRILPASSGGTAKCHLRLTEALAVLDGNDEGFNHLRPDVVTIEGVEFC